MEEMEDGMGVNSFHQTPHIPNIDKGNSVTIHNTETEVGWYNFVEKGGDWGGGRIEREG